MKCVWPKMRRERKVFKMKTASWELCVSWEVEKGRREVVKEMTSD